MKLPLAPSNAEQLLLHERIGSLVLAPAPPTPHREVQTPISFTGYASAKLKFLRDHNDQSTEITCYGVCKDPQQPLLVHDLIVPKQAVTIVSVDIDTEDLAEKIDAVREAHEEETGDVMHPYQCNTIWIHTHPGNCADPSSVDMDTFKDKNPDLFFVMYILAHGGDQSCRLKSSEYGTHFHLGAIHEEGYEPTEQDIAQWTQLYDDNITATVSQSWGNFQGDTGFLGEPETEPHAKKRVPQQVAKSGAGLNYASLYNRMDGLMDMCNEAVSELDSGNVSDFFRSLCEMQSEIEAIFESEILPDEDIYQDPLNHFGPADDDEDSMWPFDPAEYDEFEVAYDQ